jgi:6-pyruvoyltetrahydropterin/6-carboxytetrahydropterin synthase
MLITRKAEFSASHICRNPGFRMPRIARCSARRPTRTGTATITCWKSPWKGTPDPVTGMVLDLKALKETLNREVVDIYDHRFLNREVAPFDRVIPTPENIAIDIWNRLQPHLNGPRGTLHGVRIYETPDLYVDYSGDAA